MRRWYSPRGARRGLLIAGIAAVLWLSWAAGYVHGSRPSQPSVMTPGKPDIVLSRSMET